MSFDNLFKVRSTKVRNHVAIYAGCQNSSYQHF